MANVLGIIRNKASAAAGLVKLYIKGIQIFNYKKVTVYSSRATVKTGNPKFGSTGNAWFTAYASDGKRYIYSYEVGINSGSSWLYRIGQFNFESSSSLSLPKIDGYGFLYFRTTTYVFGRGWGRKTSGLPSSSSSWSTLTVPSDLNSVTKYVIYNNYIHALGAGSNFIKHYKFDGTTWTTDIDLPYSADGASFCVANSQIHMLGGYSTNNNYQKHYKFDGTSWIEESILPYKANNLISVYYRGYLNILGGYYYDDNNQQNSSKRHYIYDFKTKEWYSLYDTSIRPSLVCEYNNFLYISNGGAETEPGEYCGFVYDYNNYTS